MGAAHGGFANIGLNLHPGTISSLLLILYPRETAVLVARGACGSSRPAAGLELDCGTLQHSSNWHHLADDCMDGPRLCLCSTRYVCVLSGGAQLAVLAITYLRMLIYLVHDCGLHARADLSRGWELA